MTSSPTASNSTTTAPARRQAAADPVPRGHGQRPVLDPRHPRPRTRLRRDHARRPRPRPLRPARERLLQPGPRPRHRRPDRGAQPGQTQPWAATRWVPPPRCGWSPTTPTWPVAPSSKTRPSGPPAPRPRLLADPTRAKPCAAPSSTLNPSDLQTVIARGKTEHPSWSDEEWQPWADAKKHVSTHFLDEMATVPPARNWRELLAELKSRCC